MGYEMPEPEKKMGLILENIINLTSSVKGQLDHYITNCRQNTILIYVHSSVTRKIYKHVALDFALIEEWNNCKAVSQGAVS